MLTLALVFIDTGVADPSPACVLTVPASGSEVTCQVSGPAAYEIVCSGTWSHAVWVPGATTDCAYSGEPRASWGSECAIHPGGAPYGGHGIRVNGLQPFHANLIPGVADVTFLDASASGILTSMDTDCDWETHEYRARFACPAASCALGFRILDGVLPADYRDNSGALSVSVTPIVE